MVIRTQAVQFKADQKLLSFIEKKFQKLNLFFDKITTVNVWLKLENSGQVKDKVVEAEVNVPGETIFVKDSSKTFEESIEKVGASLKRQLVKYKEKKRV
jgi:putative sigma-54 modulation protein